MYPKQQKSTENIRVTVPKTTEKYWKHDSNCTDNNKVPNEY